MKDTGYYLGIDIGSVSTNVVLIDAEKQENIVEASYIRTNGQPLEAVHKGLQELASKGYRKESILGVGTTGSARTLIGCLIGADVVKNEIVAHAVAAINLVPGVRTVFEIGGQDSKIILIQDDVVVDFAMNTVCAAGTGSFLDQQAFRLKIPIEEFGSYALRADSPARIAGRCTVFAESDMIHKQQLGYSKENIIAGLCEGLVRNYLNNIAKGKQLHTPIIFQGGVAFNKGIIAAFEKEVGAKIIIPKYCSVMGAVGAAILAKEFMDKIPKKSQFKGFAVIENRPDLKLVVCNGCSNSCEITIAGHGEDILSVWGDRCGKWQQQHFFDKQQGAN